MKDLDFVLKFRQVLDAEGDTFFASGDIAADARAILMTISNQGYWAGVRLRYFFDEDLNLLRTEERQFGAKTEDITKGGDMNLTRIQYLRGQLEGEEIDLLELSEIEEAFDQIPGKELRDERENAMAGDMLDELEERVTPMEKAIYAYVAKNFGENEANDPSWAISPLAEYLNKEFHL